MSSDTQPDRGRKIEGVDPSAPVHKSPLKWMGLVMLTLVVLTALTMWGKEKVSIKASPIIPELSELAQNGRAIINAKCAECHGVDGTGGSKKGPPLLHPMYRQAVYPDYHFKRVVREGKAEKNWRFGPMPAMPEISDTELDAIVAFVREVQTATHVE